jgi:biopolymer transport protein ExbD
MTSTPLAVISALLLALSVMGCIADGTPTSVFVLAVADAPVSCGDGRPVVVKALGNGRAKLNGEPEASLEEVVARIHEVMSYRAERVVFVAADTRVPWRDVLRLIDRVWHEAEITSIVIPNIEELARKRSCIVPSRGPHDQIPRPEIRPNGR